MGGNISGLILYSESYVIFVLEIAFSQLDIFMRHIFKTWYFKTYVLKIEYKNNFLILQNIIDISILLVIIWVNVGPLDVNYWHSRMVYDGLILSSITKSYIFVKAHSFKYYQVHFKHFYFKLSIFNFLIRKQLNHSILVFKDGIHYNLSKIFQTCLYHFEYYGIMRCKYISYAAPYTKYMSCIYFFKHLCKIENQYKKWIRQYLEIVFALIRYTGLE